MKKIALSAVTLLAFGLAAANVKAAVDVSNVHVKKAIADSMTPEQLQAYKERLAERLAAGAFDRPQSSSLTPADTCTGATPEIGTLPYNPAADTTVGATDNFDLPADTTNPTCAASSTCTGAGPAGSLPRGAIYTGTGTGPDRGYRLQVSANCTLSVNMTPTTAWDLALIVYQTTCSSLLSDCVCVDDTGVAGDAETVSLSAVTGTTYFAVADGYSAGATPPGPSGPYQLSITGSGCELVPVELQSFSID